jgi:hypothetical protein
MDPRIQDLAESLLRGAPSRSLSLLAIGQTLSRHGGVSVPSLFELATALARDDRFVLERVEDPIDAIGADWPDDVRKAYRARLRANALGQTRITLRAPPADSPPPADPFEMLSSSLRALSSREDQPGVADRIREARAEYEALQRALGPDAGVFAEP